jgi:DNA-binding NtrC family response regulator
MNNMTYLEYLKRNKFKEALNEAQKEVYSRAYAHHDFNQSKTALVLEVSRGTFIDRLKSLGIFKNKHI